MSNGSQSFEQVSSTKLYLLWASALAGALGTAWILLWGFTRLAWRKLSMSHPVFVPFAATLALLPPIPLFYTQSFPELGDMTAASVALAIYGLIPLQLWSL